MSGESRVYVVGWVSMIQRVSTAIKENAVLLRYYTFFQKSKRPLSLPRVKDLHREILFALSDKAIGFDHLARVPELFKAHMCLLIIQNLTENR